MRTIGAFFTEQVIDMRDCLEYHVGIRPELPSFIKAIPSSNVATAFTCVPHTYQHQRWEFPLVTTLPSHFDRSDQHIKTSRQLGDVDEYAEIALKAGPIAV